MHNKLSVKLTIMLVLGMLLATGCTQTYSQAPLATPTLISTGLFVSPFPAGQDPLQIVADLGTQTAVAKTALVAGTATPGTPGAPTATTAAGTGTAATLSVGVTSGATTAMPATVVPVTRSATAQVTVAIPTTSSVRPATYTLQFGEFPYCIARRFNLNPDSLLAANGLSSNTPVNPGLTLTIPQTGSFPGDRALHHHPDTYTVDSSDTTIFGVACYYGDVMPQSIASANGLSLSSSLTIGQRLTIP
jgi:LysM repeat protein